MGWLFNALVMNEVMKKQDMQPVAEDQPLYQSQKDHLKGVVKFYDTSDSLYEHYIKTIASMDNPNLPKVLDQSGPMQGTNIRDAKMVKFEDLKPMLMRYDFIPRYYTYMNKSIPVLWNQLKNGGDFSLNTEELKYLNRRYKEQLHTICFIMKKFHAAGMDCPIKLSPQSYMSRPNHDAVLVDPFGKG